MTERLTVAVAGETEDDAHWRRLLPEQPPLHSLSERLATTLQPPGEVGVVPTESLSFLPELLVLGFGSFEFGAQSLDLLSELPGLGVGFRGGPSLSD